MRASQYTHEGDPLGCKYDVMLMGVSSQSGMVWLNVQLVWRRDGGR